MPNANIELVHELLGAYRGGDQDRLQELMDPEIAINGHLWLFVLGDGRAVRFEVHPTLEDALAVAREIDAERT